MREKNGHSQEEINRVLLFDEELCEAAEEKLFINQVICWILQGIGCIAMLIPFRVSKDGAVAAVFCYLLFGMAMVFQLKLYIYLDNNERIERVLERTPLDLTAWQLVRCRYLKRYLLKVGLAAFLLQLTGAFLDGSIGIGTLLYPLFLTVGLYLLGLLYIGAWKIRWYAILLCGLAVLFGLLFWPRQISVSLAADQTEIRIEKYCMGNRSGKPFSEQYSVTLDADGEDCRRLSDELAEFPYHMNILPSELILSVKRAENTGNYSEYTEYRIIAGNSFHFVRGEGYLYTEGTRYPVYGGKKAVQKMIDQLEELFRNQCRNIP